jgi:D-glycero-D-manno-heptose 1,7-bisphosphate phosphatase
MKKAVFLDRDGVLNELVLNPGTGEYEPPHSPEDLVLYSGVIESLQVLGKSGFELFLVSNQPDFAKGKTMLENLRAVHDKLDGALKSAGIVFSEYYYCYHHPKGVVPEYTSECACRKPKPQFLLIAANDYGIDLTNSWMVGDRDSDIECGKSAGVRTILIENVHSSTYRGSSNPEFLAANLKIAVQIIMNN